MASLRALLYLAACLWLCRCALAKNDAPCQPSKWNNAFNTFLKRHLRPGTPATTDQNLWERYIRENTGCDRPTQSFLDPGDLEEVKAVCSSQGGKKHKDNLCISRRPFSFITVRSQPGTCGIRSVRKELKHLILACESLVNQCLPVHFEGNPDYLKPDNNARGCQDTQKGSAPSLKMTWLWLLSVPILIIYGH